MDTDLKLRALLLSTVAGLLVLPGTQAMAQGAGEPVATLEELIVTAQKREESSLTVPMGLTALSGEKLASQQSFRLEDIVGKVPGLNVSNTTGTQIVVRGIAANAGAINAPVATYIDDTPLVGVGAFSGGFASTPNLDTFDIGRIEVLKGPQGTLYGANALGGLFKYVTNAPDASGFSAKVQAGVANTTHGDTGYSLHGMVNVPLSENLAVRVVAYDNKYGGFIDDPQRGLNDVNDNRIYGGRASLLWTPSDDLSVRLTVLNQRRKAGSNTYVDAKPDTLAPFACSLCQARWADQATKANLWLYNGTVNWDLGPAEIVSSTTYYDYSLSQDSDLSNGFRAIATALIPGGPWGVLAGSLYKGQDFVHETRLSSTGEGPWKWQAGVYYTSKDDSNFQPYSPIHLASFTIRRDITTLGSSFLPVTYKEGAAFANVNYQFTPTFDASIGGRYSEQTQTFEQIGVGLSPSLAQNSSSDRVFTYSADARWRFTPESMIYGRIAKGFAPGGPNVAALSAPIPTTYDASTTVNYELGYKATLLDNRLSVELSAFQIDWSSIQLTAVVAGYSSITNGGSARSRGVEWAFSYLPLTGLTLGFNGAYIDAELTADAPASVGAFKGDRLPITPRLQTSVSANYKWPLFGDYSGVVGADWRYSGDRYADFTPAHARQKLPNYDLLDLRAGIETPRWTLTAYVKNVGDTLAINYVMDEQLAPTLRRAYVNTPRTIGVDFTASF